MYVEVIRERVAFLGRRGNRLEVPDDEARVHVALGNVKPAEREVQRQPRRRYRRRDMRAEDQVEPAPTGPAALAAAKPEETDPEETPLAEPPGEAADAPADDSD